MTSETKYIVMCWRFVYQPYMQIPVTNRITAVFKRNWNSVFRVNYFMDVFLGSPLILKYTFRAKKVVKDAELDRKLSIYLILLSFTDC